MKTSARLLFAVMEKVIITISPYRRIAWWVPYEANPCIDFNKGQSRKYKIKCPLLHTVLFDKSKLIGSSWLLAWHFGAGDNTGFFFWHLEKTKTWKELMQDQTCWMVSWSAKSWSGSRPETLKIVVGPSRNILAMSRPDRTKPPGLLRRSRMKASAPFFYRSKKESRLCHDQCFLNCLGNFCLDLLQAHQTMR